MITRVDVTHYRSFEFCPNPCSSAADLGMLLGDPLRPNNIAQVWFL
jgi:hypothetical protein